jgi:hypothetical protein
VKFQQDFRRSYRWRQHKLQDPSRQTNLLVYQSTSYICRLRKYMFLSELLCRSLALVNQQIDPCTKHAHPHVLQFL